MLHIDALLPLYPDSAARRALLEQALAQIRSDLSDIRHAILAGCLATARQHAHRAKGTACFLGSGDTLPAFDLLSQALRAADQPRIRQAYVPVESALRELESALRARLRAHREQGNTPCPGA
ncbi:hypothetical protein [Bordetella petrii]|uniref:HPt domain-containing protein n=1 Tax=Bordetella petrii (strain ATCC BAA-461 / DSM 12804 / CCUG 43448 / CIP 107267 / Se-1111R) TaxID=340100 RepID=A9IRI3_BORPD|nr:hypothetical protein [Bordetella petrii]CAP43178.1 hypothetical protein predicted by Glimmer/Critica [Bordetella petrii]